MFRKLLRQIDRAMLSASAAERHHQALESTSLIVAQAGVHERSDVSEILVHAFLMNQVIHHGGIFPCEIFESFFTPRIWETSHIENESAAMSALVLRQALVK